MSEPIDFNRIKPEHMAIHARLDNWGRWCRGSRSGNVHPMFRQYRNDYFEPTPAATYADTLDAVAIQKAMKDIPERQRIALQWFYVKPGSPRRVCAALGESNAGLLEVLHQARTMMKNVANKIAETA